ncbi:MAG: hypothetical protein Kow0069_28110 [Promethearchaeota archaeon]
MQSRNGLLPFFLLALIVSSTFPSLASASSFHRPVAIDGSDDWPVGSVVIDDSDSDATDGPSSPFEIYDVRANFTEDYLYLAVNLSTPTTGDLFVAFDYDPATTFEISDLVWNKRVHFLAGSRPELVVVLDDEAVQAWDRSSGSLQQNASIESRMSSHASGTFKELKLARSDLANATKVNLTVIETATEDFKAALDVAPDDPGVNGSGLIYDDWDYISTFYQLDLGAAAKWDERSVALDGDLSDFQADELVVDDPVADASNDGGDVLNVSAAWNATHVFFGVNGPILSAGGAIQQHVLLIGIDAGPGGGTDAPWDRNVTFQSGDSAPNFVVVLGYYQPGDGPYAQLFEQSGSTFVWKENLAENFLGWTGNKFTEVGVPRASLGNPSSLNFTVLVCGKDPNTSAVDSFPNDAGVLPWYSDEDMVGTYQYTAPGTTRNVVCDGFAADWQAGDYFPDEPGDTIAVNADLDRLYATWNQDYLYLGVNGSDPSSGASYAVDLFFAFDFQAGGSSFSPWAKNVAFTSPFLPDAALAVENEGISQFLEWNGSQWVDSSAFNDYAVFAGFATEVRVPLANVTGGGSALNLTVYATADGDSTSAFDVAPDDPGVGPAYWDVDAIASGVHLNHLDQRGWKPHDPYPPSIVGPADFEVEQLAAGVFMQWSVTEAHPSAAVVYVDGTPNPVAFSSTISYPVDTSTVQSLVNYTLWVNDTNGQVATDEVLVNITAAVPPSFDEGSLVAATGSNSLDSAQLAAGASFLDVADVVVSVNVTEQVGFDEVWLHYTKTGAGANESVLMITSDTGSTRNYSATIPQAYFGDGDVVSLWFTANDTQGLVGYLNNSGQLYNFTGGVPPSIDEATLVANTSSRLLSSAQLAAGTGYLDLDDVTVSVNITEQAGFDAVLLHFGSQQLVMTSPHAGTERTYSATVAAGNFTDGAPFTFWITATDTQGLQSVLNNSGVGYSFTPSGPPQIDEGTLSARTAKNALDSAALDLGTGLLDDDDVNVTVDVTELVGFDEVQLFYSVEGGAAQQVTGSTSDAGTTRTYWALIPATALNPGDSVSFWWWANDSQGFEALLDNNGTSYNFTVAAPPSIDPGSLVAYTAAHSISTDQLVAGSGFVDLADVVVNVTAAEETGFDQALLYYRVGSAGSWTVVAMTTPDSGTTRTFTGTVPVGALSDGSLVTFWVVVNDTQGLQDVLNNSGAGYSFRVDASTPVVVSFPGDQSVEQFEGLTLQWVATDAQAAQYRVSWNASGSLTVILDWTPLPNNTLVSFDLDTTTTGAFNVTVDFRDSFGQATLASLLVVVTPTTAQYLPGITTIDLGNGVVLTDVQCDSPFDLEVQVLANVTTPLTGDNLSVLAYYLFTFSPRDPGASFSATVTFPVSTNQSAQFAAGSLAVYLYDEATGRWVPVAGTPVEGGIQIQVSGFSLYAVAGAPVPGGDGGTGGEGEAPGGGSPYWMVGVAVAVVAAVFVALRGRGGRRADVTVPKLQPSK